MGHGAFFCHVHGRGVAPTLGSVHHGFPQLSKLYIYYTYIFIHTPILPHFHTSHIPKTQNKTEIQNQKKTYWGSHELTENVSS